MVPKAKVDETDAKILKILVKNARSPLKEIAKECKISSSGVLKRIERLKTEGIIIGTEVIVKKGTLGYPLKATIGITTENTLINQVATTIRQMPNVVVCARSIGHYNLFSLVIARDLQELNSITQRIKNSPGVRSISINMWIDEPCFSPENIEL